VSGYLVLGGAGSLEVVPGVSLVTPPEFPVAYQVKPRRSSASCLLRQHGGLNWTFSPPLVLFIARERTGKFRPGTDQLVAAVGEKSWISFEDFALAIAGEIKHPAIFANVLPSATDRQA
jgi:uncharacterized protein